MKKTTRLVTQAASIAAIYVVLTEISSLMGLSSGVIQVRFSEALTVLPIFTPAAIPGLFVGCIIANILAGSMFLDVVFGSLATLIGAYFTYLLRKRPVLATLPPILSNTLIIPFVLRFVYAIDGSLPYFILTVGIGEIISCGILGTILARYIRKNNRIFKNI